MSIFKQASKKQLRFETSRGQLSVEQLWDLKMTPLATLIKFLKDKLSVSDTADDMAFLETTATEADKTLQLKFDVAKAIYVDKKEERDTVRNKAQDKEHNAKIDALIAQRQDKDLEGMSIEQLEAMRK
jgi:hypothetical protein